MQLRVGDTVYIKKDANMPSKVLGKRVCIVATGLVPDENDKAVNGFLVKLVDWAPGLPNSQFTVPEKDLLFEKHEELEKCNSIW